MNKNLFILGLLTIITSTTYVFVPRSLYAEEEQTIRIGLGETVEIGTDSQAKSPEFSWILTKNRKLQNAHRKRFVHTLLAQPGTYVLDVSIQDTAGGASDYRAFTIIVTDQPSIRAEENTRNAETVPLKAVLRMNVPTIDGKAYVPAAGGLVKIDPSLSEGKISSYNIDVDSTIDSDGDGNPVNDKDTTETLSQKNGTPFYFYTLPRQATRVVTLTVNNVNSPTLSSQTLELKFDNAPPNVASSAGSSLSAGIGDGNVIMEKNGLEVGFRVGAELPLAQGKQLLYTWDFGDRTKSLLTSPRHTYNNAGSYAVSVSVRDIATGEILWMHNDAVTVEGSSIASSSVSSTTGQQNTSSESSVPSSRTAENSSLSSSSSNDDADGLPLFSILLVGFIIALLIGLAVGMYFFFQWIKNKATGKLQNAIEKMESSIVKNDAKNQILETTVEPMKLKKNEEKGTEAIRDRELSTTEFKTQERANNAPTSSSGPVPSWLAKSQNGSTTTQNIPQVQEKPSTVPKPAVAKPTTPIISPSPTVNTAPDWLKKDTKAPVQSAPILTPMSNVVAEKPKNDTVAVPDWLKPAAKQPVVPSPMPPASPRQPAPNPTAKNESAQPTMPTSTKTPVPQSTTKVASIVPAVQSTTVPSQQEKTTFTPTPQVPSPVTLSPVKTEQKNDVKVEPKVHETEKESPLPVQKDTVTAVSKAEAEKKEPKSTSPEQASETKTVNISPLPTPPMSESTSIPRAPAQPTPAKITTDTPKEAKPSEPESIDPPIAFIQADNLSK